MPVTVDNFCRAETDMYMGAAVKDDALGKLIHHREPTPIDKQIVIRMNRDTLYSEGVFDLDAGPVTIALPDAGERFMSMQVLDEDQYTVKVIYGSDSNTFTKEQVGRAIFSPPFAPWLIRPSPVTLMRFTRFRMPSRWSNPAAQAPSRCPVGIPPVRRKFGMH